MNKLLPNVATLKQDTNEVVLQLDITPDIHWFNGHFPDTPILAGVVQLDWAVHYASQYFTDLSSVTAIEVLKFQQMIKPHHQLQLQLQRTAANTVLFNYTLAEHKVASGRLKWSTQSDV